MAELRASRVGQAAPKARKRTAATGLDYNLLLTATLCLLALGAVMVFSASSTTRILNDGSLSNSAFYLKRTLILAGVGLVLMHLVARLRLDLFRRLTPAFLAISFFLLFAVLAVGTSINGTKGWIGGGFAQIQPAELMKLALILYGADLLANRPERARSIQGMMPLLMVTSAAAFLVMLQPDLGTMLVAAFAVLATLIAAGARIRDLALIGGTVAFLGLMLAVLEPYRRDRILTFLDPAADPSGTGFQVIQAKIALGSGGLFGVGIGNGVQKAFYLPEAHTDMIAAVIGEELGLIGISAVIGLFGLFGYAGFRIAKSARDRYGKILAGGLTSLILAQAMVNLYAVMGMAPLTGVPLPFVSYGNNSLLVSLVAVGLLMNVARGGTAAGAARERPGAPAGRPAKLRVLPGGRDAAPERKVAHGLATSRQQLQAQRRHSGGRHGRPRDAGARRRRRAP